MNRVFDAARRVILSDPVLAAVISVAIVLGALAWLPEAGLPQ